MSFPTTLQEALPLILLGLALLVVLWVLVRASRKTKVIGEAQGDVLDDGANRAARNQALIDADPSAQSHSALTDSGVPIEAPEAEPVPVPAPAPTPAPAPAPQTSNDLTKIKGLGPKLATLLGEQGVTSVEQIARWSDADITRIDATLGRFQGRIERDKWVEQAKLLVSGDDGSFNETFGNK